MFANYKTALGFAGVTIVFAIVAVVLAGRFIPSTEPEVEEVVVAEEPDANPTPSTSPPTTTWSDQGDDGGFSDDWNGAAVASALPDETLSGSGDGGSTSNPEFGDFAPSTSGRQASSSSRRSGSSSGQNIVSGAAPGAPPLNPPGGGPVPLQTEN